jgi:hypothetical protein
VNTRQCKKDKEEMITVWLVGKGQLAVGCWMLDVSSRHNDAGYQIHTIPLFLKWHHTGLPSV